MLRKCNEEKKQNITTLLDGIENLLKHYAARSIGYPSNFSFALSDLLEWWSNSLLSSVPLNDVGDPKDEKKIMLSTKELEKEVLYYFSRLFYLSNYWGYITPGGTQGNEQGLFMGREYLRQFDTPILYYSEESHYSVATLARLLDLESRILSCKENGEVCIDRFYDTIDPNRPALLLLSIGTTFKGAIDPIETFHEIIVDKQVPAVYYHADAALFGGYLPYLRDVSVPSLDFSKYPFHSISVSGHKFFGSPVPLGLFLTHSHFADNMDAGFVEYVQSNNIIIPCSRSSLNTLIFYWTLFTTDRKTFENEALEILETATYLYESLQSLGYPSWKNLFSNIVFFKQIPRELAKEWSIPSLNCKYLGPISHIVCMQHVDKECVDSFLQQLKATM